MHGRLYRHCRLEVELSFTSCLLNLAPAMGATFALDPVQFRVAIPAADPPDNIAHDPNSSA